MSNDPNTTTSPEWNKDSQTRKMHPIARGVLDYFPDAVAAVAHVSYIGNAQHNPGEEMHWARHKSTDHADCIMRHMLERGTLDTDGLRHTAKIAWRALAMLQLEIEAQRAEQVGGTLEVTEAGLRALRDASAQANPTPVLGFDQLKDTFAVPNDTIEVWRQAARVGKLGPEVRGWLRSHGHRVREEDAVAWAMWLFQNAPGQTQETK